VVNGVPQTRSAKLKNPVAAGDQSSADMIAAEVVRGLYAGRYVAGQRLIEGDLTRDFKVSRGTIREALRRLAAEGVVTLTLHRGAYIRRFTKADVRNVLAVVEVLIGLAARTAAERIGEGTNRAMLERRIAALLALKGSREYFDLVRVQNDVLRAIIAISGNPELERALPSLNVHFLRDPYLSKSPRRDAARRQELRRITAAIFAANAADAENCGREHIRQIGRALLALPDEAFSSSSEI
jgi:DNA-binding GntR family transcriptional regulator